MIRVPRFLAVGIILVLGALLVQAGPPTVVVKVVQVPMSPLDKLSPQKIAKELLTPESYKCWHKIVEKESHFNPKAQNPTSTASGIGQLLEGTYSSLGMQISRDGTAQLVAMLAYVNRRFGGKNALCSAWKFHQEKGWY